MKGVARRCGLLAELAGGDAGAVDGALGGGVDGVAGADDDGDDDRGQRPAHGWPMRPPKKAPAARVPPASRMSTTRTPTPMV